MGQVRRFTALSTKIINKNDAPTGTVTISGNATEDQVLTVDASALGDADGMGTVSLQWQSELSNGTWSDIAGATSTTLTLNDTHVGSSIRALRLIRMIRELSRVLQALAHYQLQILMTHQQVFQLLRGRH